MQYVCAKCGRAIDKSELEGFPGVKCPGCGYRVLVKVRPPIVREVLAR